jgi:hypothetical protein
LLAPELARLLAVLDEAGIPAIPLKGVALAEALYGDPGLRVFSDIDILVPAKNFADAFRLFRSSGYRPEIMQPALLRVVARYGKDCEFFPDDAKRMYAVELHCGLVWGGSLERLLLEEVWSEAERRKVCGVPAFALSADWELLYLGIHAARHGNTALKWLVDLDRLCSRGTIDWPTIQRKPSAWHGKRRFASAFRLVPASSILLSVPGFTARPRLAGTTNLIPPMARVGAKAFFCFAC